MTRRTFHVLGVAMVAFACGLTVVLDSSCAAPASNAAAATSQSAKPPPTQTFHSQPNLHPPTVTVSTPDADPSAGFVFVDAQNAPQVGPMILDSQGNLVWFHPLPVGDSAFNLRVQTYQGEPVLTWWQGKVLSTGHGQGEDVILDNSYQPLATVQAGEGYQADLHEFLITSRGTALITAYQPVQADLTSVGGPRNGSVFDCIIQEIDIKTGRVLWEWHALGHVPLTASYAAKPTGATPFDFFHVNSIQETPAGNLIVSARNTWAVYDINRSTGAIIWQVGGKGGSFHLGPGTQFEWQHDAQLQTDGTLTLFDDAANPKEESQSRALRLGLDTQTMSATLISSYAHIPPLLAGSQGNMQELPNGNVFVGWGDQPHFSEYTPSGELVFDGSFPAPVQSYRAYRNAWTARPTDLPVVAISTPVPGQVTVYASWNGATNIAAWQLLAGSDPNHLSVVAVAPATGFETAVSTPALRGYVAVQALDNSGGILGTSASISP